MLRPVLPSLADEMIAAIAREVPDYARAMEGEFGQVVRVDVGEARVFGVIIGLRTPAAEQAIIGPPNQIMDLDLIGEILETDANARFRRGVSEFPRLGDRVSAAGSDDLRAVVTQSSSSVARTSSAAWAGSRPAPCARRAVRAARTR